MPDLREERGARGEGRCPSTVATVFRPAGAVWLPMLAAALFVLAACAGGERSFQPSPALQGLLAAQPPNSPAAAAPAAALPAALLSRLSTLDQLALVQIPQRDLRDLTVRLNPAVAQVPPVVNVRPPVYVTGQQLPFLVHNIDTRSYVTVTASLVYSTPVAYVWVEAGQPFDRDALERTVDRFSNVAYPAEVATFGSEWRPGVDNDPRLHILLTTGMGQGTAGYFSSTDEYSRLASPSSNEKEMFYINLDVLNRSQDYAYYASVLAHEFQHMIHWNHDRSEDTWVTEGLSEYAKVVAGYAPKLGFANVFQAEPGTQLTTWSTQPGQNDAHYGAAFLFIDYLAQRFGDAFIHALVASPARGMAGIAAALRAVGSDAQPDDLFADWVVANFALDPAALGQDGRYGYRQLAPARAQPIHTYTQYPIERQQGQVFNFATDYVRLQGSDDNTAPLTFHFQGQTETRLADTAAPEQGRLWWSNRADYMDARLSRRFDLSTVAAGTPVTLTASLWWDLEENYDYGYVMASRDGVKWQILPGPHTRTDNPAGNNLGAGYTGRSGPPGASASAWVTETYDLSSFAGGPVWIRFETLTDDAVDATGWLIDRVQIDAGPQLLHQAPGPDGSWDGWMSEGWLLTDNRLPQRWLLQVLEFEGDRLAAVRRIPVDGSGAAAVPIAGLTGGRSAVIAISGLTPATTLPAGYGYFVR